MHISIYICTYIHIYVYIHICICIYKYVYVYTYMSTDIYPHIYTSTSTYIHIHTYKPTYTYIPACPGCACLERSRGRQSFWREMIGREIGRLGAQVGPLRHRGAPCPVRAHSAAWARGS